MTHLPSVAMTERASLSERRARVGPWVWFADTADIVEGVYEGTRLCTVCGRMIGEGELDFLIVLASAVALRVDQECLELWREAVMGSTRQIRTLPSVASRQRRDVAADSESPKWLPT